MGLYECSKSAEKAIEAGFKVMSVVATMKILNIIMILISDKFQVYV